MQPSSPVLQRYTPVVAHFFYLARCGDGSLYSGTCIDLQAREALHNAGKGAKYTRARLPVKFVYHEAFETLSDARKREAEVKRMKKLQKESLITTSKQK